MLNSTSKANAMAQLKVSSASGILQKSHPKSKFIRYHINSNWATNMENFKGVILQTMICADGWMISEYVAREDYDISGGVQ